MILEVILVVVMLTACNDSKTYEDDMVLTENSETEMVGSQAQAKEQY